MKTLVIAILLLFTLAACTPDPRNEADAYRTRILADQQVADQAAARAQANDIHMLEMQSKQAQLAGQVAAHNLFVYWVSIIGTIAACTCILATAGGFSWAILGTGKAVATFSGRFAIVHANLIPLDVKTRQYPLVLHRTLSGKYTLSNPNTGSIAIIDMKRLEDRQMISSAGAVQFAGMVAHEARLSKDPAGVAVVNAPVIGAQDKNLRVGLSVVKQVVGEFLEGDDHE